MYSWTIERRLWRGKVAVDEDYLYIYRIACRRDLHIVSLPSVFLVDLTGFDGELALGPLSLDGDITYSIDNKVYLGRFSLDDTACLLLRHAHACQLNAVSLPCVLHLTLEGGSLGIESRNGVVDVVEQRDFIDEVFKGAGERVFHVIIDRSSRHGTMRSVAPSPPYAYVCSMSSCWRDVNKAMKWLTPFIDQRTTNYDVKGFELFFFNNE
jgi:hypothetical protein